MSQKYNRTIRWSTFSKHTKHTKCLLSFVYRFKIGGLPLKNEV